MAENLTTPPGSPESDQEAEPGRSRRRLPLLVGLPLVVLVVAGGVGVWYFFIRDTSPDSPDIESAAESLEGGSGDEASSEGASSDEGGDVEGTWAVDPDIGSFDDFSGTYAGYRIDEELGSVGANEAVGRTPDVTGELVIEGDQVTSAEFEVDMTTLESDSGLRDGRLQSQGLETDTYPTATFELSEALELPDDAASGETLAYEAVGDLTLHGETRQVAVGLDALLTGGEIAIVVNPVPIALDDYNIEKPSAPSVLGIDDEGEFELQAFLTRS